MYLPNEIINIIFSYKEPPIYNKIFKEIITPYLYFIEIKPYSLCSFKTYFFRLWLPIWKRWPQNYPKLLEMKYEISDPRGS